MDFWLNSYRLLVCMKCLRKIVKVAVHLWVEDPQDVVHEADDLLDELVYENLRCKVEIGKMNKVLGGLGKTTLTQMIFNHEAIKGHFDNTIWVCVSKPFIIINILEGIFQSLTKTSSGLNHKGVLLEKIQKEMHGKMYFLVLDDVWNEESGLWDDLGDCLKQIAGKSGNCIIVTTRSLEVANIVGTVPSHRLKKLSDDQCWFLFKESANANRLSMNPKLEIIRDMLVKKIGGVPLVAKVLGGATKLKKLVVK
ncbi:putative disease resistance protein RGA3 [Momordica charantia]|uniref:Disease resistance protein RGA3 n=1 Tax=Momordica charantia TaxID=3673 RepID=A0A6J1CTN6_MOMCH|nr:putative disease resistance protein RGA3 [Momordica charantia]